jgi:ElaB/YqjD/DUF883 family membrane-anchored ribosome-binding protein
MPGVEFIRSDFFKDISMIEKIDQESAPRLGAAADRIREEGRHQAEQARQRVVEYTRHHQEGWSKRLGTYENALHQAADTLRKQDGYTVADYADRAAEGMAEFSKTLRESDPKDLLARVEDYARRQPGLALGLAIGAGLVIGRFLRSTSWSGGSSSGQQASAPASTGQEAQQTSGAEGAASQPAVGMSAAPGAAVDEEEELMHGGRPPAEDDNSGIVE